MDGIKKKRTALRNKILGYLPVISLRHLLGRDFFLFEACFSDEFIRTNPFNCFQHSLFSLLSSLIFFCLFFLGNDHSNRRMQLALL
ncbi:hypothetical protein PDIP_44610 [Penicillium digitatum Pd1]|uniref:Uncharacterized protein n=1 Tax=Penicillium digitatum (strain Pd1 / CECT 20795) TaxID=1170230 RepID=K9FYU5_PEND1|nr:hypothetical protein PDIP_44610 [Penicillium digitatum Pd1]EKV14284.1 hypothetical protein PDIP_44610 [Penicillium digitatum Pd1]